MRDIRDFLCPNRELHDFARIAVNASPVAAKNPRRCAIPARVRETRQLPQRYIITQDLVLLVALRGIDWISIIMKYWLPVTRQPPQPGVPFRSALRRPAGWHGRVKL